MGKKGYIEVGEVLTCKNGKKYLVKEEVGCTNCAFVKKSADWCESHNMQCNPFYRLDSKPVIFIRRKSLEPMKVDTSI